MAARRLLIILVLLLGASVLAASIAPDRTSQLEGDEEETSTTTTEPDPVPGPTGDTLTGRILASVEDPETVRASVGDQLGLLVDTDPGQEISIEDFGLTEFAEPDAPARFDLLLREPGAVPITGEDGEIVGRLLISAAGTTAPEEPPEGSRSS